MPASLNMDPLRVPVVTQATPHHITALIHPMGGLANPLDLTHDLDPKQ
jgi:hypothetical protein